MFEWHLVSAVSKLRSQVLECSSVFSDNSLTKTLNGDPKIVKHDHKFDRYLRIANEASANRPNAKSDKPEELESGKCETSVDQTRLNPNLSEWIKESIRIIVGFYRHSQVISKLMKILFSKYTTLFSGRLVIDDYSIQFLLKKIFMYKNLWKNLLC